MTKPVMIYLLLVAVLVSVLAIADGAALRRENAELRQFIAGELAEVRERAREVEERIEWMQVYLENGEAPAKGGRHVY